jgi:hypothetical protein
MVSECACSMLAFVHVGSQVTFGDRRRPYDTFDDANMINARQADVVALSKYVSTLDEQISFSDMNLKKVYVRTHCVHTCISCERSSLRSRVPALKQRMTLVLGWPSTFEHLLKIYHSMPRFSSVSVP